MIAALALGATAFCALGTLFALALLRGARHTGPYLSPLPPILRTTPREHRPELDGGAR